MNNYTGELAALATSFCWSFGSIFFTFASRSIGSNAVNRIRLALALVLIVIVHVVTLGKLLPTEAMPATWLWFGISGVIGFAIGDSLLFRAFVLIGPRLSMLMMALAPVIGTVIAWLFLGEVLEPGEIAAILITLLGIVLVIRETRESGGGRKKYFGGLLCGLGAAAGQALGLVLSKKGLASGLPSLSGNLIRVLAAVVFIWVFSISTGSFWPTIQKLKNGKAVRLLGGGVVLGPFLGVWLSLIAVQHAYVGIASTLMALPPIILIPLSHWIFKERITFLALVGTLIAVGGVALIFVL